MSKSKKELRKQLMTESPTTVRMRLDEYDKRIAEHPDDACISTSDLAKILKEIMHLHCSDFCTRKTTLMSSLATIISSFTRHIMNYRKYAVVDDYLDDFFTVKSELDSVLDSYIEKQD